MSLFKPHPCGTDKDMCSEYGKCNQFECEKFVGWFNNVYVDMQKLNHYFDNNMVAIKNEPFKEHLVVEIESDMVDKISELYPDCEIKEVWY